jgi:hypothetical protein
LLDALESSQDRYRVQMKYWEIIADNLSKAGWSLGWVSAIDSEGRQIWIADASRGDGKRFIVRADEQLTAFLELEARCANRMKPLLTFGFQKNGTAMRGIV